MLLPLDVLSLVLLSISTSPFAGILSVSATLVNVTIDDTFGDPATGDQISYAPEGTWQPVSCAGCTAKPNPSQVSNSTWHEGTFNPDGARGSDQLLSAAVSFEGVAVYVFCVVTHSFTSPVGNSDMSFFLDGNLVGTFQQPPNGNATYEYNVPVYVNESLPPGQHTIVVVNGELGGNTSLTLLDYIVYTRDVNSTASVPASLTPTDTALAAVSTAGSSATPMATSTSASSSSKRTIIIAVVASIAGVLVIVAVVATIIYFGRRRARANAREGSRDGVIAPDAAPIDQENPNASGWVEGTWAGDDESELPSAGGTRRTLSSGRRKRGPSNGSASASSIPNTPSTRSLNKPLPTVSDIQIPRLPFSRADPVSPSSSFGNLGSAPPNSATFFVSPPPPVPPLPSANAPPTRPPRPPESDTFLDLGQSFTDTNLSTLSTHAAHPFATAQSYTPSAAGYTRQRSATNTSTTIPPPSASTGALAAATRGHVYASAAAPAPGPSRKRSGSDLSRDREREHAYARANAPSRQRSGSDTPNPSPYTRVAGGPAALRQRSGSDLEVNYGYRSAAPPAPARKRSGSDLESNYASASASAMSPTTTAYASTLPSTATSPTSMTALVPKRGPSPQAKEKSPAGSLSLAQGTSLRAAAAPRRVDPVDPSLQPSRDPPLAREASSRERDQGRERERERERERAKAQAQAETSTPQGQAENRPREQAEEQQAQSLARARSGRRVGLVMSDRDRQRFGFLDVPQDAGDSRPPSYREADR